VSPRECCCNFWRHQHYESGLNKVMKPSINVYHNILTYQTCISLRQHQQSPPCFLQLLSQQECLLLKASVSIETQYASYHYLNYSHSNTANLLIHQRVEGANDDSNSHVGISKGHQEHCQTFASSSSHTYKTSFPCSTGNIASSCPGRKL